VNRKRRRRRRGEFERRLTHHTESDGLMTEGLSAQRIQVS
jgi:hypothetical protein